MDRPKLLFVDDDAQILLSMERHFRRNYDVVTALSAEIGIESLQFKGPFAVVIADLAMPEMDGDQFLTLVREKAPNSVRIMLTGHTELETALKVVNHNNVFRFLLKPCPPDAMTRAVEDAVAQYRLLTEERAASEKTLSGSIQALAEILAARDPVGFDHSLSLRDTVNTLCQKLNLKEVWDITVAAMLSPLGNVMVPPEILQKVRAGEPLNPTEQETWERRSENGRDLLAYLPRLTNASRIVYYQSKHFDGQGFPPDAIRGEALPLGSRILKVLNDLNEITSGGITAEEAFGRLRRRTGWYDPNVLNAAYATLVQPITFNMPLTRRTYVVDLKNLATGQVLLNNIETVEGVLLISAGSVVTGVTLERINNYSLIHQLKEPVLVKGGLA